MRVTDFIQKEWSANVAIIPLSGSADGWKGPTAARTEGKESLGNEREGDLRQRGERGPPRFEKGAQGREGRGGMSKQYYSKGAKKRENVLPASRLVTRSFILHPPPIPISISSPVCSSYNGGRVGRSQQQHLINNTCEVLRPIRGCPLSQHILDDKIATLLT